MSCQISSTQVVAPSRRSVLRSHGRAMDGPCSAHNKLALMYGAPLPPHTFRTEQQLTAPADRPVRAEVGACAVSKGVAAGYVWCRLSPPSFTDHRNRPGSPPATYRRQKPPPALPVNHIRCSADHRPPRRRDAGADVSRAVGVCLMGRTRAARGAPHLTSSAGPRHTASVRHLSGHRIAQERRCKVILKEPHARAA